MGRRKGEMTAASVDQGWPHQVALTEGQCGGARHADVHAFCLNLSLCPRGHSVYSAGMWFQVFCFAEAEHAAAFQAKFGGEPFDPRDRGRGSSWARWNKGQSAGRKPRATCEISDLKRSGVPVMPYESEATLDGAVAATIKECGGDPLAAIRALLVANAYLEEEVVRLAEAVSRGYARRDPRRERAIGKSADV